VAVAGLAVACLALVVAFGTAVVQHRQNSRMHSLEEARRLDELQPRLTLTYDDSATPSSLLIGSEGPLVYDDVELTVTRKPQVIEVISFVDADANHGRTGPIARGDVARLRVQERHGDGGELRMRAKCYATGGRDWTVVLTCEVPNRYRPVVY
jgi:uncharacterized protein (DUF2126 family)